jgi:hypothetical protein
VSSKKPMKNTSYINIIQLTLIIKRTLFFDGYWYQKRDSLIYTDNYIKVYSFLSINILKSNYFKSKLVLSKVLSV